jgi:hypothetical protein
MIGTSTLRTYPSSMATPINAESTDLAIENEVWVDVRSVPLQMAAP